jgi:two-component system, OmpR family, phosphate regulon response regulator PhoB
MVRTGHGGDTTTKSILIIEDEKDIADLVEYHLKQAGFSVFKAFDGPEGLESVKRQSPGLVILDLMLPSMDGKDICRALKSNPVTRSIPILMLTARAEEVDRIVGFELGADDYVTKPFSPRELVLRVKAILQRSDLEKEGQKTIRAGDLFIDIERHRVTVKDTPITLTSTEFKLLLELTSSRGRVQTRGHLLNSVWGYTYEGYARTVDTHIRRLREKLGIAGDCIETIRGVGYRFREDKE